VNRRGFLKRLGAAAAGIALSGHLSGLLPPPPALRVPKQFTHVAEGISVRFIRQWDAASGHVARLDILYGVNVIRPEFAVRVVSQPRWWERWLR
jgi:hypothetical protein